MSCPFQTAGGARTETTCRVHKSFYYNFYFFFIILLIRKNISIPLLPHYSTMKKIILPFLFTLITLFSFSQDVIVNVTGKVWKTPTPLDSIIVENLSQPDTIIFKNLPQEITTYIINLSRGICINEIKSQESSEIIRCIENIPGRQKFLMGNKPEVLDFLIFTIDGKQVLKKQISCRENTVVEITSGRNLFHLLLIKGRSINLSFLLTGGSENNDIELKEKISEGFYARIKSTIDFLYSPGDWIKFTGIKNGLYSNFTENLPYSNDSIDVILSKPCPGTPTVVDFDGNSYKTVQIGDQCWLRENLKSKHYANGVALVDGTGIGDWGGQYYTKYWFDYDDNPANSEVFGRLYSAFAAVNTYLPVGDTSLQGICPNGWHLPSNKEWGQLENFLDPSINWNNVYERCDGTLGEDLREGGMLHWVTDLGNNKSGFTALGAGANISGIFNGLNSSTGWWCGNVRFEEYLELRSIHSLEPGLCISSTSYDYAIPCRCIKD